jgi:AcrR family transcriptional regulator
MTVTRNGTSVRRGVRGAPHRRRSEILDLAARVFYEKGYHSTSIQNIADAVGILKGSLYYYISSKEDLLFEILKEFYEEATSHLGSMADVPPGGALEELRSLVTRHVTHGAENVERMALFFREFRSLSVDRRAAITKGRDPYNDRLGELIAAAQVEQTICPDIDPKLASNQIIGMMGWIHYWYRPDGTVVPSELADEVADFIIASMACDAKHHSAGHRRRLAPFDISVDSG